MITAQERKITIGVSANLQRRYAFTAIAITLSIVLHIVGLWIAEEVIKQQQHENTKTIPNRPLILEIGPLTQQDSARAAGAEIQTTAHVLIDTNVGNPSNQLIVSSRRSGENSRQLTELTSVQEVPVHYFSLNELTQRPLLSTGIDIVELVNDPFHAPGAAHLRVLINELGSVDNVLVEESTLATELEQIAVNAFRQAMYKPGQREGKPVRTQILVEVSYDGGIAPTQM